VDFNALLLGQKCGGGLRDISGCWKEGDGLALDIWVSLSSMYSLNNCVDICSSFRDDGFEVEVMICWRRVGGLGCLH
jgi:hypothetical protein